MATDFSIDALLNSPTRKSRNVPEHRIEEIPVPGRVFTPVVPLDSNGKYIWLSAYRRARIYLAIHRLYHKKLETSWYTRTARGKQPSQMIIKDIDNPVCYTRTAGNTNYTDRHKNALDPNPYGDKVSLCGKALN